MFMRSGYGRTMAALLGIVCLAGCRPTARSKNLLMNSGITYDFTDANITQQSVSNADVLVKTDAYTFQNKGNHLTLNGRPCGIVKQGDKVVVKGRGTVLINGLER